MQVTKVIKCPYCREGNDVDVEVEADNTESSDTRYCEHCAKPYFYSWTTTVAVKVHAIDGYRAKKA